VLLNSQFKKIICPFGVIIAGTDMFAWTNLHFTALVIANLLDPQNRGKIYEGTKYDKIRNVMSAKGQLSVIIGGGVSEKDEQTC
jgi:hypothetical protein